MKVINPDSYNFVKINEISQIPKYLQLVNAITNAVESNILKPGAWLPSINQLSYISELSRDTVQKSYNYLKNNGTIASYPGKGFVVVKQNIP